MWVTTRRGFFSVVQHRDDAQTLLVRARARRDLENMVRHIPGSGALCGPIEELSTADYRFRVTVPRDAFKSWLNRQVDELNYDSHCKEEMVRGFVPDDQKRYRWYLSAWQAGHDFQEGRGRHPITMREIDERKPVADDAWRDELPDGYSTFEVGPEGLVEHDGYVDWDWDEDADRALDRPRGTTFSDLVDTAKDRPQTRPEDTLDPPDDYDDTYPEESS